MSKSLNDIIKRSGFGEKMGIKLKQKKKPVSEVYSRTIIGKTSGIKIENYSLKSTINEIINYKRGIGESTRIVARSENFYKVMDDIWKGIVKFFEDVWNFITTKLKAFWDWITGKGKESTKASVEKAFKVVSGEEKSTTNNNPTNTSNTTGSTTNSNASNNSFTNNKTQNSNQQTSSNSNSEGPKVQISCIIGTEERFGKANTLLMEIIDKTREYANAVDGAGTLLGAYEFSLKDEEVINSQKNPNSTLSKAFVEWTSSILYGKKLTLSELDNNSTPTVAKEIEENMRQLNDLVGPKCEMNKNNYQDCYHRWKSLEKKVDKLSEELDRLVKAFTDSIEFGKKFCNSVYKIIERNKDKFNDVDTSQYSGTEYSKFSSMVANMAKDEQSKIMKSMKEFLDKIKPDVNVKF